MSKPTQKLTHPKAPKYYDRDSSYTRPRRNAMVSVDREDGNTVDSDDLHHLIIKVQQQPLSPPQPQLQQQQEKQQERQLGQQQPFQVVLIDIRRAANEEIHCVKKPLFDNDNLSYIAISYRWGELHETTIDTQVGYLASVTSFELTDFYKLCATILVETSMESIDYVWVDAICINQANYQQRKSTICHMTSIYERARHILAVPDLHAAHLKATMSNHRETMGFILQHQTYIYHLLHGDDMEELYNMDDAFLDDIGVPKVSPLRQLLTKYTDCFTDSFMELQQHDRHYNSISILDHLYDIHGSLQPSRAYTSRTYGNFANLSLIRKILKRHFKNDILTLKNKIKSLHSSWHIDDMSECPLNFIPMLSNNNQQQHDKTRTNAWPYKIHQRAKMIRQSIHFLTDLITDWSSRVWVISEFHIAKKKKNMKFWFTQLTPLEGTHVPVSFFDFDIHGSKLRTIQNKSIIPAVKTLVVSDPVYLTFYQHLASQLHKQTFLEMMLKSKASKNEDRFYSIFPLHTEYQHLLNSKEDLVKIWHITSILSVKLKLYDVMKNDDKQLLLYLSNRANATFTLPTFTTPTINWKNPNNTQIKTDPLDISIGIELFCKETNNDMDVPPLYYLRLTLKYYRTAYKRPDVTWDLIFPHHKKQAISMLLQIDPDKDIVDIVQIPRRWQYKELVIFDTDADDIDIIYLIGNFKKNVWILGNNIYTETNLNIVFGGWRQCRGHRTYFHVY